MESAWHAEWVVAARSTCFDNAGLFLCKRHSLFSMSQPSAEPDTLRCFC